MAIPKAHLECTNSIYDTTISTKLDLAAWTLEASKLFAQNHMLSVHANTAIGPICNVVTESPKQQNKLLLLL